MLPGKGNSNSHGARPVHLIITMIKWIRTEQETEKAGEGKVRINKAAASRQNIREVALSQSMWVKKIGEPGFFSAPKLTNLYRTPGMST